MIFAHEIMTPNPKCIAAESEVSEVAQFFLQNFVSSAPVKDASGRVLGQLNEIGLMRAIVRAKAKEPHRSRIMEFADQFMEPQFVLESDGLPLIVVALIHS